MASVLGSKKRTAAGYPGIADSLHEAFPTVDLD
jgi:hypothetical protein